MVSSTTLPGNDSFTIEFFGHSTVLFDLGGYRVLCDPHLDVRYGGGLYGFFRSRSVDVDELGPIDAIVVSHNHTDHFDVVSLSRLDRTTPLFCPDDAIIASAADSLGFVDVRRVDDWSTYAPAPDIELVWTPSTFRVPEHGLAIRVGQTVIWNVVDTHVEHEWVDRLLDHLGTKRIDIGLITSPALLETEIVAGLAPIAPADRILEYSQLIDRARPRVIVPFGNGLYTYGPAAWMNHQTFPMSERQVERLYRRPDADFFAMSSGDRLAVESGAVALQQRAVPYLRRDDAAQDRRFHPGGWIEPLTSLADLRSAAPSLDAVVAAPIRDSRDDVVAAIREYTNRHGMSLARCRYEFLLVDQQGRAQERTALIVDEDGSVDVATERTPPDIEVALGASDFTAILDGSLNFACALMAGRVREWRPGPGTDDALEVFTSFHAANETTGRVVISGQWLLHLFLRRRDGFATAELERDLRVADGREEVLRLDWAPPSRDRATAPVSLPVVDDEASASFWASAELALLTGRDPSYASGTYGSSSGRAFFGAFGRGRWCAPDDGATMGRLVLHNLLEAQPHLGAGVRSPAASYAQLIENLMMSPIRHWIVDDRVPLGTEVARWRLASLRPFSIDRLRRDLARRGCTSVIEASTPDAEPDWWLGVPPMQSEAPVLRAFPLPGGGWVPAEVRNQFVAPDLLELTPSDAVEPLVRFDWGAGDASPVQALLAGSLRCSWLLMPEQTRARFPLSRSYGFDRWLELVAVTGVLAMSPAKNLALVGR
jgi:hypothetical protein